MVQPINYLAAMPQIDIAGQLGEIGDIFGKRMQQRQAQEQARQAQEQYARDLQEAFRVANPQAFAQLIAKYPGQREALGDAAKLVQQDVLDNDWKQGLQIASALENNAPDVARRILQERVDAAKNAGEDPGIYGQILSSVEAGDIQGARGATNFALSLVDPKRFGEFAASMTTAEQRPAIVSEAKSKAQLAATVAKFAESKAVQDLRLGEAQIKKLAEDTEIARMNARIAAMNAATSREGNDLKRQELQLRINEMQRERDSKTRERVATVEAGRASMDNMLNTIDRVLKNPALNDVIGSLEGRMPAAASALDDQESDAIALIETLGSQAFLAQIPNIKGMGALSNAEGEKLQSALQNLSRAQSEKQFRASLKEAQRLVLKGRKNLSDQYGVPDTVPDTPAAEPSAAEVDALINRYAR